MDITTLPVAPLGASALVALVVLYILRGALIPRSVHEDRMGDKDRQIENLQATNTELLAQNTALMQVGYTAERVLVSLGEAAGRAEGASREEVASS